MSTQLEIPESTSADNFEQYRALSTSAVASLIVGLLSVLAILDWTLAAIPLIGVALGSCAWLKVKRHGDELVGGGLAAWGFVLSLIFLIAGPSWLAYVYFHEVPEGYERVSFAQLQPDPQAPGQTIPPSALALEGKRIFIKGFPYPGQSTFGIKQFLLVRDQGDCCFGGNPKITDRIQVTLADPLRLNYQPRMHNVAGTFHVDPLPQTIDGAKGGVFYHLQADHLQ